MKKLQQMLALMLAGLMLCSAALASGVDQQDIPYMAQWPDLPTPYVTRDWAETARQVTLLAFDAEADQKYFPLSYYFDIPEPTTGGYTGPSFGSYTYLRETGARTIPGEAVTQLAATLTASLTEGLDARNIGGLDYVRMAQVYFQRTPDGRGFISNNTLGTDCAGSFWYTFYPTMLYFHLAAQYPEDAVLENHLREVTDTWLDALPRITTWDATGYSLKNQQLTFSGHIEPEGIFGAAYVMLMAYARFGEAKYLDAAVELMREAADFTENPYYEILGSYAPVIAARLNAEENAGLPLARLMDWVFDDGTVARPGWGVISESWGDYDAYGLSGSTTDTDGYAFAMNTFVTAGALAPVARYAPQYSRELGKYLTAVASNSHMFFSDGLPAEFQDDADYVARTGLDCLVYEGVRHHSKTEPWVIPFATGDAKDFARSRAGTNFSFYSSGPIGMLSAIIGETNVPEILAFDLLKTDFEHGAAYPTYLLYNPLAEDKRVELLLPAGVYDVFDAVRGELLCRGAQGHAAFALAADDAVVAVLLPAGAALTHEGGKWMADGVVVRYPAEAVDIENVADNAVLGGEQHLKCLVQLGDGNAALGWRLFCHGKLILTGEGRPEEIAVTLPAGNGALRLEVDTSSGRVLSCSKGVRALPVPETALLHLADEALMAAMDPRDTCTMTMDPRGVMVTTGEAPAELSGPCVTLRKGRAPMLLVEVTYSWGPWGVSVDVEGVRHTIQPSCAGEGVYLYDLTDVLPEDGDTARAALTLQVGRRGCRVAFRKVSVFEVGL